MDLEEGGGGGCQGATGAEGAAGAQSAAGAPTAQPARGAQPTGRGAQPDNGDFTTVQRYDQPVAPSLTAQDEFLEFLFSGSDIKYSELKQHATNQDPIPPFALKEVKLTFDVDADYTVVRTQLTHNVVAIIPGTDPKLKDTYVAFGAHYDHIGYSQTPRGRPRIRRRSRRRGG